MKIRHASAENIRRTLLSRINSGEYTVGNRIPPARALADEFSANRNTVNKAFQELARAGIVSLVPGRGGGTFVRRTDAPEAITTAHLRAALGPIVAHARTQGLRRAEVAAAIQQVISETYEAHALRVVFLECNPHDAQELAQQLAPVIDCPIDPAVIEQENLASLDDRYDVIVTTFHHLAEVARGLGGQRRKVIGVNAVPTADVVLKLALLEAQHLGLVCGRENTAQSMKYLVSSYRPDVELDVSLVDDVAGVRAVAERSQALLATYSCAERVVAITGRQPEIVIEFYVDAQSIEFLRQRVAQLQQERATRMASAVR